MNRRCVTCSSGLSLMFDHIIGRTGWWCSLCKRWEDGYVT